MSDQAWTVARVRAELPGVDVLTEGGKRVAGRVCGRENDFPTVWVGSGENARSAEFAWSTIAHCLNTGRPLRF